MHQLYISRPKKPSEVSQCENWSPISLNPPLVALSIELSYIYYTMLCDDDDDDDGDDDDDDDDDDEMSGMSVSSSPPVKTSPTTAKTATLVSPHVL